MDNGDSEDTPTASENQTTPATVTPTQVSILPLRDRLTSIVQSGFDALDSNINTLANRYGNQLTVNREQVRDSAKRRRLEVLQLVDAAVINWVGPLWVAHATSSPAPAPVSRDAGDVPETTTDNPQSWIAWKRRALAAEAQLRKSDAALLETRGVPQEEEKNDDDQARGRTRA